MKRENQGRSDHRAIVRRCLLFLVFTIFIGMLIRSTGARQAILPEIALTYASQLYNLPANRLSVVNSAWLAQKLYRAKVRDAETGSIYVVSLKASGEPVREQEVEDLIETTRQGGFSGKIEAHLNHKSLADPAGVSPVTIWVKAPDVPRITWLATIQTGGREQVFNEARVFHAQAEAPVLHFLAARAIPIKYASPLAPIIEVDVPNSLLPILERLPQVTQIYLRVIPQVDLNVSIPAVRADQVWAAGYTGSGAKVAIVEGAYFPDAQNLNDYYSALPSNNPYLGATTNADTSSPRPSFHAAYVAGVIASTHMTYKGMAYGVNRPILCANAYDPFAANGGIGLTAATDWAVANADVVNQSYGNHPDQSDPNLQDVMTISPEARHDDYLVQTYLTTITCSTGNDPSRPVQSPANGYNVIGVGAFDTKCNQKWSNDIMAGYSTFINPKSPHNDREKPEIVAPGNVYSTTEASPWIKTPPPGLSCDSGITGGTSFSAPHVAGAAALLIGNSFILKYLPEVVKAILMASAVHNIEGASRLSDKDGAGGLEAKAAFDVLVNGWTDYVAMPGYSLDTDHQPRFTASAGQTVRVVICWLSASNESTGIDVIKDADLTVISPGATQWWTSASFDNNFEIVEFIAPATGIYRILPSYKFGTSFPLPRIGYAHYVM